MTIIIAKVVLVIVAVVCFFLARFAPMNKELLWKSALIIGWGCLIAMGLLTEFL